MASYHVKFVRGDCIDVYLFGCRRVPWDAATFSRHVLTL
jgi:hypothetical protein